MRNIAPCLWFDNQAEEAARFYVSIFDNAKITRITHYNEAGPRPVDMVMTVSFVVAGQEYMALNGGPEFTFTPAISFSVNCDTQEELDRYWDKLSAGGQEVQCGWLTDKFGVSWQIVPSIMPKLLDDSDPVRAARVMRAMLPMIKLDLAALQRAYDGE